MDTHISPNPHLSDDGTTAFAFVEARKAKLWRAFAVFFNQPKLSEREMSEL